MHNKTDHADAPETDGSAGVQKVASSVGSGDQPRSGESPDASTLLRAWTPERYAGDYPPYINLSTARPNPGSGQPLWVRLTVRQPTIFGQPPGETTSVLLNSEMWREFVKMVPPANEKYEARDFLDSLY